LSTQDTTNNEKLVDDEGLRQRQDSLPRNRQSQHEAASVTSSVPSSKASRRDSAISSSSRNRPKRKASRSKSHQPTGTCIQSSSNATSGSSRPHPRRITSSPHIQGKGPNIDEALALHERSCRIFGSFSRPTTSSGAPTLMSTFERPALLYRSATATDMPPPRDSVRPPGPIRAHTAYDGVSDEKVVEEPRQYKNFVPATIIHWNSVETRRKEYQSIDKANKGVRGFFKKLFPIFGTKASGSRFYDEKEGSDAGSVRRFRLDLPDGEETVATSRKGG